MVTRARRPRDNSPRFGIGEWYGYDITKLPPEKRQHFGAENLKQKKDREPQPCPFKAGGVAGALCSKEGGVCSLRLYAYGEHPVTGRAMGIPVEGRSGDLRTTCPYRFHESLDVFNWVGETILGDPDPLKISEVGFLEAGATTDSEGGDDVGRIDMVLVSTQTPPGAPMEWAALEIQAVYFSGNAMRGEFKAFEDTSVDWLIYPPGKRRPDYRSSGPKRLMPQLQIKVPTLRRWGKKMAVVVDRAFFDSIGEMDNVNDISNADIAWFIVRFEEVDGGLRTRIVRDEVRYTTLERSVEGLTGGKPVPLTVFESRINTKKPASPSEAIDLLTHEDENEGGPPPDTPIGGEA